MVPMSSHEHAAVPASDIDPQNRLVLEGISKQYPGCLANDSISLRIKPGSIHALLGENGAGKSTLMKIIYGLVQPDAGRIMWEGKAIAIANPAQARRLGIGMVLQHFALFETLTVLENIALGLGKNARRSMTTVATRISAVAQQYGMALEPQRPVHTLSAGERQRVEIVRCLMQDTKLLILDEPTSALTPLEVDALFATLRQLVAQGTSIVFISHKLKEVQALCDYATVLRHGAVVDSCKPAEHSAASLAEMMVGAATPVTENYAKVTGKDVYLRVTNLCLASDDPLGVALQDIKLNVQAGEIVGIAGVAGNGQSELLTALSGERLCHNDATIRLAGVAIGTLRPDQRRQLGLAVVPEDRLGQAAVGDMSLRHNGLLTGFLQGLVKRGFLQAHTIDTFAATIIDEYNVKCGGGGKALAKHLSGGNLQKFIIGRELLQNPTCLIAAHPTWGVDVAAAIAIHEALLALRDSGSAILVVSEDLDELFTISDRLCVLFRGRLSPLKPTVDTSIEEVGQWMGGIVDDESMQPTLPLAR